MKKKDKILLLADLNDAILSMCPEDDLDARSWGYEEGVLISLNQAS